MYKLKQFWSKLADIKRETLIRNSFLLPILFVVIISISHVITWYDIGNPWGWAIYLSIAVEVFALASIAAATVHMSKATIWFLFGIVTSIQMIGNIFFAFNNIDEASKIFLSWIQLIQPIFPDWDTLDHRRFLSAVQGGSLPIMSLTALHFFITFNTHLHTVDDREVPAIEPEVVIEIPEPVVTEVVIEEPEVVPTPEVPNDDEDMAKFNPEQ